MAFGRGQPRVPESLVGAKWASGKEAAVVMRLIAEAAELTRTYKVMKEMEFQENLYRLLDEEGNWLEGRDDDQEDQQ